MKIMPLPAHLLVPTRSPKGDEVANLISQSSVCSLGLFLREGKHIHWRSIPYPASCKQLFRPGQFCEPLKHSWTLKLSHLLKDSFLGYFY